MLSQGLLFSEPSIAETGVWCNLSEGIDPAQWSRVCRYIGTLSKNDFELVKAKLLNGLEGRHYAGGFRNEVKISAPLISIGPSGIGGQYQNENFG